MLSLGIFIVIFRLIACFLVQTWFVPDETWQVTEVAHNWTFGYGYLCWEWREAIRSIFYPGLFSLLFSALSTLKLDYPLLLIHFPRIFASILFSVGDYHVLKTCSKLFGKGSQNWIAVFLCTSWFLAYCAPRTLTSCAEMAFLSIALSTYPWHQDKESTTTWYLRWGGIGCVIRPTTAVFLLPFCVKHFYLNHKRLKLLIKYVIDICIILSLTIMLDSAFYGRLTIVPWNFLKFNVISGLSSHYGTHSWHWYFTQGIPVTLGIHLAPILYGISRNFRRYLVILLPCVWGILIHSILGHKEFRFLLPIIPLLLAIGGDTVHTYLKNFRSKAELDKRVVMILLLLVIPSVPLFLYMSLIHQRGPIDVMHELRNLFSDHQESGLLFLTPCHSTPLFSHLHIKVSTRFLTCEPNLQNIQNYKDEADIFFEDPLMWIQRELLNGTDAALDLPTHIVMYDTLAPIMQQFLKEYKYRLLRKVFNSHFYDGNRGAYFHLYSNT